MPEARGEAFSSSKEHQRRFGKKPIGHMHVHSRFVRIYASLKAYASQALLRKLMNYAFFKPLGLETLGYAYGAAEAPAEGVPHVAVTMLATGRWEGREEYERQRSWAEFQARKVTEQEALSGIGTYIGASVCVQRPKFAETTKWDYGVVTGYRWDEAQAAGVLHVSFDTSQDDIQFDSTHLADLEVEAYALRPCQGRAVADVMIGEMVSLHEAAVGHFTGKGRAATRKTKTILSKLQAPPVDESLRVPLYDLTAGSVVFVSLKHILDFTYYKDGKRAIPKNVTVGETIFGEPGPFELARPGTRQASKRQIQLIEQTGLLSDSGEDSEDDPEEDDEGDTEAQPPSQPKGSKRKRNEDPPVDGSLGRLLALKKTLVHDPDTVRVRFYPTSMARRRRRSFARQTCSSPFITKSFMVSTRFLLHSCLSRRYNPRSRNSRICHTLLSSEASFRGILVCVASPSCTLSLSRWRRDVPRS